MVPNLEKISLEFDKIGEHITVKPNQTLIDFNKVANRIYLVKKGGLVLLFVNPNTGAERAINFFIPNFHPIATIAESFAMGNPSKYRLVSFTHTELIEVKKSTLDEYLNSSSIAQDFQMYGVKSLLDKNELRAMLISLSSEEMLQYLHHNLPQILQNVPSKYVADFLGITPQWLSKLKHKL